MDDRIHSGQEFQRGYENTPEAQERLPRMTGFIPVSSGRRGYDKHP